jgi:hypothetical protein
LSFPAFPPGRTARGTEEQRTARNTEETGSLCSSGFCLLLCTPSLLSVRGIAATDPNPRGYINQSTTNPPPGARDIEPSCMCDRDRCAPLWRACPTSSSILLPPHR